MQGSLSSPSVTELCCYGFPYLSSVCLVFFQNALAELAQAKQDIAQLATLVHQLTNQISTIQVQCNTTITITPFPPATEQRLQLLEDRMNQSQVEMKGIGEQRYYELEGRLDAVESATNILKVSIQTKVQPASYSYCV